MKSKVIETEDKVFIDKIPRLEKDKNRNNSFIRSSQVTMNALGNNYTYEYLMGISGAAFRLHFQPDWCPSSADSTTGFDVSRVLFKSLGYDGGFIKIDDNSLDDIKSLYKKIKAHIDSGNPVIAINLRVCPEWGVIAGYLKEKPGLLCRTYFDDTEEYSLAERAPWLTFFISEKAAPLDDSILLKNSLEMAVELAKTENVEEYKSGFSAFEKWIEELKKFTKIPGKKTFKEHEVNLTIFDYLLDSRRAAALYLESMNTRFKLKRGDLIIDNYKKEALKLEETRRNILPGFNSKPNDWTEEIIDKQVNVLNEILEIEKESINLIRDEIQRPG